jgi:hypothetical protein
MHKYFASIKDIFFHIYIGGGLDFSTLFGGQAPTPNYGMPAAPTNYGMPAPNPALAPPDYTSQVLYMYIYAHIHTHKKFLL